MYKVFRLGPHLTSRVNHIRGNLRVVSISCVRASSAVHPRCGAMLRVSESLCGAVCAGVDTVATKHGVSKAQVLLRRALDRGVAVIPGATSAAHIRENLNISRFHLSTDDRRQLESTERPRTFKRWRNQGRTPLQETVHCRRVVGERNC